MLKIPAHKQIDIDKKPGQIVNKIQTLGDYVAQVFNEEEAVKKKLSFDDWWDSGELLQQGQNPYRDNSAAYWAYEGWKAAQENK